MATPAPQSSLATVQTIPLKKRILLLSTIVYFSLPNTFPNAIC